MGANRMYSKITCYSSNFGYFAYFTLHHLLIYYNKVLFLNFDFGNHFRLIIVNVFIWDLSAFVLI